MNIAIDCTFFGHAEARSKKLSLSTSIFTADILDAFVKMGLSDNFTLFVNYNHASFFQERFPQYKLKILKFFPLTLANKISDGRFKGTKYLKKLGIFKRAVKKGGFDSIWFPYCVDYTFVQTALPALCTIHDIYPVHRNGMSGWNFIKNQNCTLTTVSNYTKNDIIGTFGLDEARANSITKIPNSIIFDVSKKQERKELSGKKYILDLNAYIEKKNPLTLLKAFNLIKEKTNATLVFCGGYKDENLFAEMKNFIEENSLFERVLLLFRVTDEERNWLLTNATLFVTPSLFEGFGRTPVEAAICKIPVISTKETSLFEATLGLCNYVENPKDENELAELILKKLGNPDSEEKLTEIAKILTENYEPETLAKRYMELFSKLR
ncbi:glycosyltransferase [uncultured Treponema sp.]|uniref:glycosyltransferase n=1 Tax=uncultured Treponema sp. TaxID=162155 RepID=UPI0025F5AFF5|nr:glycosyltransferase [uncultured Treponema sp.]